MKVTFVVNHAAFFCSHRLILAEALIERGIEFSLIIGRGGSHEMETKALEILKKKKIEYFQVPFSNEFSLNFFREFFSILKIYYHLIIIKPNYVQLISPKAILFGGIASKLAGIKNIIFTISGLGYFYTGKKNFKSALLKEAYFFLFKKLITKNSKLVCQNIYDLKEISKKLNILDKNFFFLIPGSGVDDKKNLIIKNFNPNNKNILLSSRILTDKGIVEFIKSANILKSKYRKWNFYIAGALDYKSPSSIKKNTFIRLIANKNVKWLGYVQDMEKILLKTTILCLPSYREGMSKSLIEAAMYGIPIVTTDVPGCRDVLLKNQTGELAIPKNVNSLVCALEKLMTNKKKLLIYSKRAKLFAKKNLLLEK